MTEDDSIIETGASLYLALMVCLVAAGVVLFGVYVISLAGWFLIGYLFP